MGENGERRGEMLGTGPTVSGSSSGLLLNLDAPVCLGNGGASDETNGYEATSMS